jgi:hypothetical protein
LDEMQSSGSRTPSWLTDANGRARLTTAILIGTVILAGVLGILIYQIFFDVDPWYHLTDAAPPADCPDSVKGYANMIAEEINYHKRDWLRATRINQALFDIALLAGILCATVSSIINAWIGRSQKSGPPPLDDHAHKSFEPALEPTNNLLLLFGRLLARLLATPRFWMVLIPAFGAMMGVLIAQMKFYDIWQLRAIGLQRLGQLQAELTLGVDAQDKPQPCDAASITKLYKELLVIVEAQRTLQTIKW